MIKHMFRHLQIMKKTIDTQFQHALFTKPPNANINHFSGYLTDLENLPLSTDGIPVKNNNLILRGCVLRNTDSITAVVVYSGCNTKAVLNNNDPRKKVSYLERLMNRDVIWCVVLLIILCLSAAVASVLWERETSSVVWTDWYNKKGGDVEESRNNFSAGFFIFLTMVILLQILIPISLYVSIELVKLAQVIIL